MALRPEHVSADDFRFPVGEDRAVPVPATDKPSTRDALLAAAVDAFGQSGFEGVSVREVERRAGVNRGLVAHYFGTKDALWEASVDWLMAEFRQRHERHQEFMGLVSPVERARIVFKIYALFVAEHPEFFRLLLIEGREASERTRLLADRYMMRLNEFFESITGLGTADPEERAIRHLVVIGALSVAFAVPGYSRVMFGVDPSSPDFAERLADFVGDLWLGRR